MKFASYFFIIGLALASCKSKNSVTEINPTAKNIDSLLQVDPNNIEFLLFRGNIALDEYRFQEALSDGARAFRLDSLNPKTRMLYASALLNRADKNYEDVMNARRHLEYVIIKEPKNTDALIALASTCRLMEDVDGAFKYVNEALRIDDKKREAYALKGSLYNDLGNTKLAISSYETAKLMDPNYFEAYLNLGLMYQRLKDTMALEYFESATKLQPENEDILYTYAFSLELFNKYKEAAEVYRRLSKSDQRYYAARGLFHQGHIKQRETNEIDSAMYFYTEAIIIDKDYIEAYHNRGMCLELKGKNQQALKDYESALAIDENYSLSNDAYDRLYAKIKR